MNVGMYGLPDGNAAILRPALVLLEQRVANNSPALDFVNWYSPDYDEYQIHIIDMLPVNSGSLLYIAMRCSSDGGASYDTGNNYSHVHHVAVVAGAGIGGANATNFMGLISMGSTNANWGGSGVFHFNNPAGARYKQLHGTCAAHDNNRGATDVEISATAGAYLSANPVNALRFQISAGASGNISSGMIRIYGVIK
jgi:hypothetical protein